jgi:iron complex transport system ATP-binding protein
MNNGDFVALAGPNGSGKSTLIKCLCGILKIRDGKIKIEESAIEKYSANRLAQTIAYIPQSERGNDQILVFDAVLAGRKPYINWRATEKDYKIVADVLQRLGIEQLSMRYVNELSGGQQQTVMIARALAQQTKILLLDEPTANLDIRHQTELMKALKALSKSGLTIIMSIHDINTALRYVDKILMLKDGKIISYCNKENITKESIEQLYDIEIEIINHGSEKYIIRK